MINLHKQHQINSSFKCQDFIETFHNSQTTSWDHNSISGFHTLTTSSLSFINTSCKWDFLFRSMDSIEALINFFIQRYLSTTIYQGRVEKMILDLFWTYKWHSRAICQLQILDMYRLSFRLIQAYFWTVWQFYTSWFKPPHSDRVARLRPLPLFWQLKIHSDTQHQSKQNKT